jgi:hypothetical protein
MNAVVANTLRALRRLSAYPTQQDARPVAALLVQIINDDAIELVIRACDRDITTAKSLIGIASLSFNTDDADPLDGIRGVLAEFTEHLVSEAAISAVNESADALDAFLDALPSSDAIRSVARLSLLPNASAELALAFLSPNKDFVVWERHTFEGISPTALALWLVEHFGPVVLTHAGTHSWAPSPLYRYHPERFRHSRSYAKLARKAVVDTRNARVLTIEEVQARGDLMIAEINARLNEVDRRRKLQDGAHPTIVIESEEQLLSAWLNYCVAGRQIFEIPAHLSDMLRNTDADDIPVNLLRAPYPALYMKLGPQRDLELEVGWPIDGVYVEYFPEDSFYCFTFTALPASPTDINCWHAFGEPVAVVHFTAELAGMDLGAAVDHALSDLLQQLASEQAQGDQDATAELHLVAATQGVEIGAATLVNTTTGSRATQQIATTHRRHPAMRGALQLAVNALCYLTAYPDDAMETWPIGTPPALVVKTRTGTPRDRAKAASQLEAMGYTKVRLCGTKLPTPAAQHPDPSSTTSVRPHWRRGHWRRQPHGEGRAFRKLIWLMPTLVHRDHHQDDTPGHIYEPDA